MEELFISHEGMAHSLAELMNGITSIEDLIEEYKDWKGEK